MAGYHAYAGGKEITDFYIGGKQTSEIYAGNTLVWTRSGEVRLTGEYMIQFVFRLGKGTSSNPYIRESHTYIFFAKNGHKKVKANVVKAAAAYWIGGPVNSINYWERKVQIVPAFVVDGDILYDSECLYPVGSKKGMYYYYNIEQVNLTTGETTIKNNYAWFVLNSTGSYTDAGYDLVYYNNSSASGKYKDQYCNASIVIRGNAAYYSTLDGGSIRVAPYTNRDDFKLFNTLEKLNTYLES